MPFPFTLGAHTVPDPPALASLVLADASAGGGRVVAGQSPDRWLAALVADGVLERPLAVALAAALIQRPTPASLSVGARFAATLGDRALTPLLTSALDGHDVALLMARDPLKPDDTLEETLLVQIYPLLDLQDPTVREASVVRYRNAGLRTMELRLLAEHGSHDELERWLPAVLAEALDDEQRALLRRRAEVDPTVAPLIGDHADD